MPYRYRAGEALEAGRLAGPIPALDHLDLPGFGLINERAHLPCALVLRRRDVDWLGGCMADVFGGSTVE